MPTYGVPAVLCGFWPRRCLHPKGNRNSWLREWGSLAVGTATLLARWRRRYRAATSVPPSLWDFSQRGNWAAAKRSDTGLLKGWRTRGGGRSLRNRPSVVPLPSQPGADWGKSAAEVILTFLFVFVIRAVTRESKNASIARSIGPALFVGGTAR